MKISITDKASEMIKKTVTDKKVEDPSIRIYIKAMGWGGPSFGIALDEQKEKDYTQSHENVNYVVEEDLLKKYGNFEIDYVNSFLSKGFQVRPSSGGSSCS